MKGSEAILRCKQVVRYGLEHDLGEPLRYGFVDSLSLRIDRPKGKCLRSCCGTWPLRVRIPDAFWPPVEA